VALSEDYLTMIDRAPREDFVVKTLARRDAGAMTLMMGELVIAGEATRAAYDLARAYPLHFRKTYYPGRFHGDPVQEHALHERASAIIDLPPPIGATRNTFRSCFLPGTPLDRLSPLGTEPATSNIKLAQELSLAAAVGLWRLTEEALALLTRLQTGGVCHGDAHLHNFIVCPSPLEVLPIDFEIGMLKDAVAPEAWNERCQADRRPVLTLAIYLQCTLGLQHGPLADQSIEAIEALVEPVDTFQRAIDERTLENRVT
jgi:hypothetical protein